MTAAVYPLHVNGVQGDRRYSVTLEPNLDLPCNILFRYDERKFERTLSNVIERQV
jgi:hypothetical protein